MENVSYSLNYAIFQVAKVENIFLLKMKKVSGTIISRKCQVVSNLEEKKRETDIPTYKQKKKKWKSKKLHFKVFFLFQIVIRNRITFQL